MVSPANLTTATTGLASVRRLCIGLLGLTIGWQATAHPASARLGEEFPAYKAKTAKTYSANGEKKEGNNLNTSFNVQLPPDTQKASPGYSIAVTVTSVNGKISGQSMTVRTGMNPVAGGGMATIAAFFFGYEAIGKPVPRDKAKAEDHFRKFSGAVAAALLGTAQNVRFPGYAGTITLRRDPQGNLLVAVK